MDEKEEFCHRNRNNEEVISNEMPMDNKCKNILPCGHNCQKGCYDSCTTIDECMELVDSPFSAFCGHAIKIPCFKTRLNLIPHSYNLMKHCNEPCNTLLKCEHICKGTCSKCVQRRYHIPCTEKCDAILICGHPCVVPCRKAYGPCTKECLYHCSHSRCTKMCGEPCVSCQEPCARRCEHQKCSNRCGEICSVGPCDKPCPKRLICGHICIGFCGETCPPQCRECDSQDDTFDIFFGNETEPDARFVYLTECKHSLEANGLKSWFQQDTQGEIGIKRCPKCKTVVFPQRFSEYIKIAYNDVNEIKKRLFGSIIENQEKINQLKEKIIAIINYNSTLAFSSEFIKPLLEQLLEKLNLPISEKMGIKLINAYSIVLELTETLLKIFAGMEPIDLEHAQTIKYYFNFILTKLLDEDDLISDQKITNIKCEINRFERILQLSSIIKNKRFLHAVSSSEINQIFMEICKQVDCASQFTDEENLNVRGKLIQLANSVDQSFVLTEVERKMIINVMNTEPSRWYKCPNGHFYSVDSCGAAMEVSTCNECGAYIGGVNHILLSTNTLGEEMHDTDNQLRLCI